MKAMVWITSIHDDPYNSDTTLDAECDIFIDMKLIWICVTTT
jgi:hypothetical protein